MAFSEVGGGSTELVFDIDNANRSGTSVITNANVKQKIHVVEKVWGPTSEEITGLRLHDWQSRNGVGEGRGEQRSSSREPEK